MSIETYGTGERIRVAARLSSAFGLSHLVILPVPTTRDKQRVANTDILLSDTLCNAGRGSLVVGYALPAWYRERAESLGASVLDISLDEEFQAQNAYITAIGALSYILSTSKSSPDSLSFGVVGYGRIGSRLVRMLLFLGAKVKVYTSKTLTRFDLGECGIDSATVSALDTDACDFSGIDILINTAPKDMSASFPNASIPSGMRVLELASGENFAGIEGVERLPALPDRMYPESAGLSYASAIKRFAF